MASWSAPWVGVLERVDERVDELHTASLALAHHSALTAAKANLASRAVTAHFLVVSGHGRGLRGVLDGQRKAAAQGASDVVNLRRALTTAALSACPEAAQEVQGWIERSHALRPQRRWVVGFAAKTSAAECKARCRLEVVGRQWAVPRNTQPVAIAPMHTPRFNHVSCVANQRVYVLGGFGVVSPIASCERYDPLTDAWESLPATLPVPAHYSGACSLVDGDGAVAVVVVGGESGTIRAEVHAFEPAKGGWTSLPPIPTPLTGCSAMAVGGALFVVGGFDGDSDSRKAWTLPNALGLLRKGDGAAVHEAQWVELPSLSTPRCRAGGAASNSTLFMCGGYDDLGHLRTAEALNVAGSSSGAWESLPDMPAGVAECGCCFAGGNVFVVGGDCGSHPNPAFVLTVAAGTWSVLPPLSVPTSSCSAVVVGKRLFVFGGYNSEQREPSGHGQMYAF